MEWAEEIKLSIRKTAALKGRRSSQQKIPDPPSSPEKEFTVDITLDLGQETASSSHSNIPPKRMSGGWADSGVKSSKSRSRSFTEDERFSQMKLSDTTPPPEDEIPIIPDLDDIKDEILMNEIVEPPSVSVNRVVTLNELNSDLLSQKAFSAIEDVDLSILTKCLQAQETLDEPDEVWEWDKLFTDVMADIHSDKTTTDGKIEIAADEVTPTQIFAAPARPWIP